VGLRQYLQKFEKSETVESYQLKNIGPFETAKPKSSMLPKPFD
jgi:hypothetical protein